MTFSSTEDVRADLVADTLADGPAAWVFLPAVLLGVGSRITSYLQRRRRGAGTPACRVDIHVDPLTRKFPERRDESRRCRQECPRHVWHCAVLLARFRMSLILWMVACPFECAGVLR
jgi:hypothetical protein